MALVALWKFLGKCSYLVKLIFWTSLTFWERYNWIAWRKGQLKHPNHHENFILAHRQVTKWPKLVISWWSLCETFLWHHNIWVIQDVTVTFHILDHGVRIVWTQVDIVWTPIFTGDYSFRSVASRQYRKIQKHLGCCCQMIWTWTYWNTFKILPLKTLICQYLSFGQK